MSQTSLTDMGVSWRGIPLEDCNRALVAWGHKMGEMRRVDFGQEAAHGLLHDGRLVAVACTSGLVRESVGGAPWLNRGNCVELSRVCAERPNLCRVVIRMWREFTWPDFKIPAAVSYQDACLHSGDLYRFDGWEKIAESKGGGSVDQRTGRVGRDLIKWQWPHGWRPMNPPTPEPGR